jgi:hypothetical protein
MNPIETNCPLQAMAMVLEASAEIFYKRQSAQQEPKGQAIELLKVHLSLANSQDVFLLVDVLVLIRPSLYELPSTKTN